MADKDNVDQPNSISAVENGLEKTNINDSNNSTEPENEERKITQTDHLNKRLLSAFLDRITVNPNFFPPEVDPTENAEFDLDETEEATHSSDSEKRVAFLKEHSNFRTNVTGRHVYFTDYRENSNPTNSGKTSLATKLVEVLPNSTLYHQDKYFWEPEDERLTWLPELQHHHWDEYKALDMDRLVADVKSWRDKTPVSCSDNQGLVNNTQVLLLDGFLMYNYSALDDLFDKKYYLMVTEEVCRSRRSLRNYEPPDVPGYFDKVVWPSHLMHLQDIHQQHGISFFDGTRSKEEVFHTVYNDIVKSIHCIQTKFSHENNITP